MTQQTATMTPPAVPIRWSHTFLHSLAFVVGFGLVFTLLGSAAGLMGRNLNYLLPAVQKIGAVMLVFFALVVTGLVNRLANVLRRRMDLSANPAAALLVRGLDMANGLFYTERRMAQMHEVRQGWGYLSSILMGVSFSAGWVPCVGPILASILFLAGDSATVVTGASLLAIFSLGLGIPFLVTGAAFGTVAKGLRRLNRHTKIISYVSGIFLVAVAYLLWQDQLVRLTASFGAFNVVALRWEEWFTEALGLTINLDASLVASAPLALFAGLIGFFSPCVLPLIPAYIGYLSGASLR